MNFFSSVVKQESVVSEEELRWEVWARTGSAGPLASRSPDAEAVHEKAASSPPLQKDFASD